ncbi:MAG: hypothetical protein PHX27_03070 [Candidatus ainarchaeum sp.]|nr:hypothetical protein [Candidatus ainarchaeum sp.]
MQLKAKKILPLKKQIVKKNSIKKTIAKKAITKKTFVTSLIHSRAQQNIKRANLERISIINQLISKGKRVVVFVPKEINKIENEYLKQITKKRNVKIINVENNSPYNTAWQRDSFTKLKSRYYNKDRMRDIRARVPEQLRRYFGEGGRVIDLGTLKGKKSIIVSNTVKESGNPRIEKEIREEISMLKRQGYNVFELPGHDFSPHGRTGNPQLKKAWFDHLDVFVNSIPEKKVLLVDPDYLKKNYSNITGISKATGFKIIKIPQKEKYSYPANFLNIGNGEVIVNSDAKQTINLLKNTGVKVFVSPRAIRENLTMRGSIGCFVNVN